MSGDRAIDDATYMKDARPFTQLLRLVPASNYVLRKSSAGLTCRIRKATRLNSRVEGRLCQTDKETNGDKSAEVLAGGEAHREDRPKKLHRGNPERRANASDEHTAKNENQVMWIEEPVGGVKDL